MIDARIQEWREAGMSPERQALIYLTYARFVATGFSFADLSASERVSKQVSDKTSKNLLALPATASVDDVDFAVASPIMNMTRAEDGSVVWSNKDKSQSTYQARALPFKDRIKKLWHNNGSDDWWNDLRGRHDGHDAEAWLTADQPVWPPPKSVRTFLFFAMGHQRPETSSGDAPPHSHVSSLADKLSSMGMTNADVDVSIAKANTLSGLSEAVGDSGLSLSDAVEKLRKSATAAGIRKILVPPSVANNPGVLSRVSATLDAATAFFKTVLPEGVTPGLSCIHVKFSPRLGGSLGLCQSSIHPLVTLFTEEEPDQAAEVLVHETVHAHDHLLARFFSKGVLLSQDADKGQKGALHDAQRSLVERLASVKDTTGMTRQERQKAIFDGLPDRWNSLGVDKDVVNEIRNDWFASRLRLPAQKIPQWLVAKLSFSQTPVQRDDDQFVDRLVTLIRSSSEPSSATHADARGVAEMMLMECLMATESFNNEPAHLQILRTIADPHGRQPKASDYFSAKSEIIARNAQAAAAEQNPASEFGRSPLCVPGKSFAGQIRAIFKDHYNHPAIEKAFRDVEFFYRGDSRPATQPENDTNTKRAENISQEGLVFVDMDQAPSVINAVASRRSAIPASPSPSSESLAGRTNGR